MEKRDQPHFLSMCDRIIQSPHAAVCLLPISSSVCVCGKWKPAFTPFYQKFMPLVVMLKKGRRSLSQKHLGLNNLALCIWVSGEIQTTTSILYHDQYNSLSTAVRKVLVSLGRSILGDRITFNASLFSLYEYIWYITLCKFKVCIQNIDIYVCIVI